MARPLTPGWSPLLIGAGIALLIGLGALAVVVSWTRGAGTALVPLQVPAALASVVGVGLVGTGLAALDLGCLRRQDAEEAEVLDAAIAGLRRGAERGRPVRTD